MQELNDILATIDGYIGGGSLVCLAITLYRGFFTVYLGFPQVRFFAHALKIVRGKFDRKGDEGDTSHFQAWLLHCLEQ